MKTLAEEIVAALPDLVEPFGKGPRIPDLVAHLGAPEPRIREAVEVIKEREMAIVVRYPGSKARHVVPLGHFPRTMRACRVCDVLFEVPKASDKKRCCSREHGIAWSWTRPGVREKRKASIKAERATPAAKKRLVEHNRRRWSKPEEHKKLSEQNRSEWADPAKRAKRSASIQAVHGTAERRKFYSDLRKENWSDPEYHRMMQERMTAGKNTPEFRAKFGEYLRKRWQDPEQRPKFMAAVKRNGAKAAARNRAKWADPAFRTAHADAMAKKHIAILSAISSAKSGLTAKEIECAVSSTCNAVNAALRVLERHGFVRRVDCGGDGRKRAKFVWEIVKAERDAA